MLFVKYRTCFHSPLLAVLAISLATLTIAVEYLRYIISLFTVVVMEGFWGLFFMVFLHVVWMESQSLGKKIFFTFWFFLVALALTPSPP